MERAHRRALRELPSDSERMLELGAVLGNEIDRAEWSDACAHEGIELAPELIEGLLRRRLAEPAGGDRLRHAHGLLGEALLARAKAAHRAKEHHQACAQMLTAKAGQLGIAERRSRHLIAAGSHEEALAAAASGERAAGIERFSSGAQAARYPRQGSESAQALER